MENWKEIKNFKGISVSDKGRIRNDNTGFIYKKSIHKYTGYVVWTGPDRKSYRVHRLVAEAFIPNPDDLPHIDHINCDKTDNTIENLRWVSPKQNSNNPLTVKHHSDYMKHNNPMKDKAVAKKVGDAQRGKILSDETKSRISKAGKGRTVSSEAKLKMSISSSKRIRNDKGQFV